jgi:hypothetical protein
MLACRCIPLGQPLRHELGVVAAVFSPDGRRVVTACEHTPAYGMPSRVPRQTPCTSCARPKPSQQSRSPTRARPRQSLSPTGNFSGFNQRRRASSWKPGYGQYLPLFEKAKGKQKK